MNEITVININESISSDLRWDGYVVPFDDYIEFSNNYYNVFDDCYDYELFQFLEANAIELDVNNYYVVEI